MNMMWSSIQLAEHACDYIKKFRKLLPNQKFPQLPNLKKKKKKNKERKSETGKHYYQQLPLKLILTRNLSKTVFFRKTAKIIFPYVKINLAN